MFDDDIRDAPLQPERKKDCALLLALPDMLALSCAVVSGNSGAPVLLSDGGGWCVAAVMVASTSGGGVKSLAARIPIDLQARIAPPPQP